MTTNSLQAGNYPSLADTYAAIVKTTFQSPTECLLNVQLR